MSADKEDESGDSRMSFIISDDHPYQKELTIYMTAIQKAVSELGPLEPAAFAAALLTIVAPVLHVQLEYSREECMQAMGTAFDGAVSVIRIAGDA